MYKLVSILIIILSFNVNSKELFPLGIGGSIYGSVNANANQPPKGRQTGISLNYIPSINFSAYLPYFKNENIGLYVDAGLTNMSYADKSVDFGTQYQSNLSYLSAAAYLHLNGFLLGINIGMPLSASHGIEDEELPFNVDPVKTLNTMAEFRVGYQIPIYANESGRLLATIMAAYQFNGLYSNYSKFDPYQDKIPHPELYPPENKSNPRVASVYIGITYLLNIKY